MSVSQELRLALVLVNEEPQSKRGPTSLGSTVPPASHGLTAHVPRPDRAGARDPVLSIGPPDLNKEHTPDKIDAHHIRKVNT